MGDQSRGRGKRPTGAKKVEKEFFLSPRALRKRGTPFLFQVLRRKRPPPDLVKKRGEGREPS